VLVVSSDVKMGGSIPNSVWDALQAARAQREALEGEDQ